MAEPIPLHWNEALSGILGSVSLAAWIFLLVPQLLENYRQHSADAISLTFLFIWFLGDVTNLAGALWAGLVPTVIALAAYFCLADCLLISQCLYYRTRRRSAGEGGEERAPLLTEDTSQPPITPKNRTRSFTDVTDDNLGLPGSRRRTLSSGPTLALVPEQPSVAHTWLRNSLSVLAILVVGAAGWAVAWRTGAWRPSAVENGGNSGPTPIGAEVLGYASAVCYLGARIPQIVKNQRDRSCEGLSLLFFILSLVGNATYGAGILFHSVERRYFLTNLPWLIGSLGTMVEDAIIFIQFSVFGEELHSMAVVD